MTKRSSWFLTMLALAAIPAMLAVAPSVAAAKKKRVTLYLQGPINKPKDPGYAPFSHLCCFPSYVPTIQIKAKFGGSKKPSVEVTQFGLWGPCSGAEYSDGESKQELTLKPRRNGTFAGSGVQYGTDTLTVSGRVLRSGTASGTVREVEDRGPPTNGHSYGTCDSGTVTWTASKVPALTDPKKSFDPTLVYPAGL